MTDIPLDWEPPKRLAATAYGLKHPTACARCGALVCVWEVHVEWHRSIANAERPCAVCGNSRTMKLAQPYQPAATVPCWRCRPAEYERASQTLSWAP